MSTTTKIVIAVVLVAIFGFAYWFWMRGGAGVGTPSGAPAVQAPSGGIGSDLYTKVAPNAGSQLPETNPFNKESNPFKAVQTNPF